MQLEQRIKAFTELGRFLSQFTSSEFKKNDSILHNDLFFDGFKHQIKLAKQHNGWFNLDNLIFSFNSWSKALEKSNLESFTSNYSFNKVTPQNVAIIMAGNIPLVGFHDFLCVLLSGHNVLVKQSSNDKQLLPFLAKYLEYVENGFKGKVNFTEEKLENFDAVIATGSNNTARYFDYYFKGNPSIIRKNRNSVAVLNGNESEDDMKNLSEDIFRYFGLGCRNVSKIFVPKGYNFDTLFNGIYHWNDIINYHKYTNNYDYNKAVYLMSEFDMLENGFFMIKEDTSYGSPIATLFYEYYDDLDSLKIKLSNDNDLIQCIVSNEDIGNKVNFGETQQPKLTDFADSIDTIEFLLKI
ncbi:acyl-CoA reductase [Aurantibacter sp.]|uniref:acyl-CoA reductase n=1 Tax=Aurantibacter sp. TaxID=2807103 RepID=UPI0035C87015